jgi:hypothetical protein
MDGHVQEGTNHRSNHKTKDHAPARKQAKSPGVSWSLYCSVLARKAEALFAAPKGAWASQ